MSPFCLCYDQKKRKEMRRIPWVLGCGFKLVSVYRDSVVGLSFGISKGTKM